MSDAADHPTLSTPPASGLPPTRTGPPAVTTSEAPPPPASTPPGSVGELPPTRATDPTLARPDGGPAGPLPEAPPGYEILAELGRGAMGVVYRSRHLRLNREVALKVAAGGGHADPRHLARFLAEGEVVAAVRHPHVVQVYDVGEHAGRPFMALEYLTGGTLADRLRAGPLPPRAAAAVVEKVARGVQAAHDLAVVHRDLKPANVLLDAAGEPKVADFGLAKRAAADATATHAMMGTPAYMSPEQADGRSKFVGPPSDVWALGVILYECLTGRRPFAGADVWGILHAVLETDPVPPRSLAPGTPRDLDVVVSKCLAKDPKRRYPTADALAADLRAFLDGRPIAARPVGNLERGWKWARRHPGRAAGVAAGVVLATGLALGVTAVRRQRDADRAAADRQRADELKAADDAARERQRQTRADALVQALGAADTAGVPRMLTDLGEVRELAGPGLVELAARPIGTKPGLHGRLAALAGDPGRAKELAEYVPTCRPEELPVIRAALAPHAAAVGPGLWAVLADASAAPGKRVRAAGALAGLAPDDPRWGAVAPAVVEGVVRANPDDFVAWANALQPVRASIFPAARKRYPEARDRLRGGKLDGSGLVAEAAGFDLTANLLARCVADRPADLADLVMTVDARHYALLAEAVAKNDSAVAALLKAELMRPRGPDWGDPPLNPAWKPIPAEALRVIDAGRGFAHERFALVHAVPMADFERVADALAPAGYRPTRVRPHPTATGLDVAAIWTRDGVAWKFASGLPAEQLHSADAAMRNAGFHPVDVAGWVDPGARPRPIVSAGAGGAAGWVVDQSLALRFVAVWAAAPGGEPVNRLYAGVPHANHQATAAGLRADRLTPLTVQAVAVPWDRVRYSGVWGRGGRGAVAWDRSGPSYMVTNLSLAAADVAVVRDHAGLLKYAAVWHEFTADTEQPTGLTATAHLARAKELAAAGWRPSGIGAGEDTASSVWRLPPTPDAALVAKAERRANAAAALLAAGEGAPAWAEFTHSPDPTARSHLVHRAAAMGVDPAALVARFRADPDVTARRALLLALGEYPPPAVPNRAEFATRLLDLYKTHPDAGLHGAIDWLLGARWGMGKELAALNAQWAAADPYPGPADKGWYVNGEGQTYSVVRGPVEFTMGSSRAEPNHRDVDLAHRKRIGRTFAIATKEVTIEQFLRFRPGHKYRTTYGREPDSTSLTVSWYDAAAYCNWLSRRAGIPEPQWCYSPNQAGKYAEGMTIKPGHLGLTGFRLPTEAEWECACRSGATTSRHFGRAEELLPMYAWGIVNSDDRSRPAGRLKPNDLGLFDTLGNACEWVEDPAKDYALSRVEDSERVDFAEVTDKLDRVLRGGGFFHHPAYLRSADRYFGRPGALYSSYGFRPCRTLREP